MLAAGNAVSAIGYHRSIGTDGTDGCCSEYTVHAGRDGNLLSVHGDVRVRNNTGAQAHRWLDGKAAVQFFHPNADARISKQAAKESGVEVEEVGHSGVKLKAPSLAERLAYWFQYSGLQRKDKEK